MSKVNDFGFTEDINNDHVDISMTSPFIQTDISGGASGKIGSISNNGQNGIGSGNNAILNNDNFFNDNSNNSNYQGQSSFIKYVRGLTHPFASLAHILFKILPIIFYLFSFGDSFVLTFILCILLLSFDFYTVKNITGRLMVGLRWWNIVLDDGSNKWNYETAGQNYKGNQIESFLFWLCLYVTPLIWLLFFLACIFKFQFIWILIPMIAISLSFANIYGFYKCSTSNNSNSIATSLASNIIGRSLMSKATSFIN